MPYEIITQKHLQNLKVRIQQVMSAKSLDNTGSASASLEVNSNKLLGNDYIYYIDHGRGPGRFPPVDNIRNWVRDKLGVGGRELNSVSFLVGRKISEQGTEIFKDRSKGIELDILINEMIEELCKELPDEMKTEVLSWL